MTRALFALISAFVPFQSGWGQSAEDIPVTKLTLAPAREASPALKHRLLPTLGEMRTGNAALLYQRAHSPEWFGMMRRPEAENAYEYLELPLAKFPRDKVAWLVASAMMKEVDLAARRTHCDWEMLDRIRDDGFALLLPDVQGFRTYGWLLSLRNRVHLLDRDFDKAVYSLQTQITLGRHVAEAPILINVLVGNAIIAMAFSDIEQLVQVDGSPNLFWALADLPRPLISLRHALQGERLLFEVMFPGIREAMKDPARPPLTVDQLMQATRHLEFLGERSITSRAGLALIASRSYPRARQYLLEHGFKAERVDDMPVLQVALMHGLAEYDRLFDDTAKWVNQPPWVARAGFKKSVATLRAARDSTPDIAWLPTLIVPAMERVHETQVRLSRRIAILQTVEAIRVYAAEHGKLPATLGQITGLPLPVDPATGNPFQYSVTKGRASLVGPAPEGEPSTGQTTMRYELSIAKKK